MNVFRKVSLDRLSSPEQLDQLMQVTDARGWIILSAFGIVLATAVLWGFLGSVAHMTCRARGCWSRLAACSKSAPCRTGASRISRSGSATW
jgi:hypothetical protein